MKGPEMMQQMETYFRQNPEQYKEFLRMQQMFKAQQLEQLTPKEKMKLAKQRLVGARMSKHQKEIIEEKEKDHQAKINEEQKVNEEKQREEDEAKKLRKKEKLQRKYAKRKEKKRNEQIEQQFEVVESA